MKIAQEQRVDLKKKKKKKCTKDGTLGNTKLEVLLREDETAKETEVR